MLFQSAICMMLFQSAIYMNIDEIVECAVEGECTGAFLNGAVEHCQHVLSAAHRHVLHAMHKGLCVPKRTQGINMPERT